MNLWCVVGTLAYWTFRALFICPPVRKALTRDLRREARTTPAPCDRENWGWDGALTYYPIPADPKVQNVLDRAK